MKRGFTFIELLTVLVIISLISLAVLPTILNLVKGKEGEINDASKKIIYAATKEYIKENQSKYPLKTNNVFCITLETLVNDSKLANPVKSGNDVISLNRIVKVRVNEFKDLNPEILNSDDTCTQIIGG